MRRRWRALGLRAIFVKVPGRHTLPVILVPNRSNGLTNAKFKMTPAARVLVVPAQRGGVKQARLFDPSGFSIRSSIKGLSIVSRAGRARPVISGLWRVKCPRRQPAAKVSPCL